MSMRRTAGRLGRGGGPGSGGWRRFFPPQPQVLQEGEGEPDRSAWWCRPRQERPSKWSRPSSSFSCWCACSHTQRALIVAASSSRGGRREVGEVVLALARGPALADQPDLLAGQVPAVPELLALGRAHPQGGELGRERPLGAAPPATRRHATPASGLGRDRGLARHRVLARPTLGRRRPQQPDRGRVDVLHLQDADRPEEPARAQAPAEGAPRRSRRRPARGRSGRRRR